MGQKVKKIAGVPNGGLTQPNSAMYKNIKETC